MKRKSRTPKRLGPILAANRSSPTIDRLQGQALEALARGDFRTLVQVSTRALACDDGCLWALRFKAFGLGKLNDQSGANAAYADAVSKFPDDSELLINLANWYLANAQYFDAINILERLIVLQESRFETWIMLASSYYPISMHSRGLTAADRAMELAKSKDEISAALMQRAIHRRELGDIVGAIEDCRTGIQIDSQNFGHHTNLMLFLLADPETDSNTIFQSAIEFGNTAAKLRFEDRTSFGFEPSVSDRKLRVGFISPDFRDHSVMYFVEGLLACLPSDHFYVIAVSNSISQDFVTERVRLLANEFIDISRLTDVEKHNKLISCEIDILIDLAGHTGGNSLPLMASRLSPIQVSMLGYPATTGLPSIDYKISDSVTDPDDGDKFYTEILWRLPTLFCAYRPCIRFPLYRYQPAYAVVPPPLIKNKFITFGSCTNLGRLSDEVLRTWSVILSRVQNSRLMIEGKGLGDDGFRKKFKQRLLGLGFSEERIILIGQDRANQYLTYHDIDIVLDPFPLTSGTTSFDCLWMGVPFVTMRGDSFRGRIGTGLLTKLGFEDLIATSPEEYVGIAVALAGNEEALTDIRANLRPHMERSVLMDEENFADEFGWALRQMWWRWLDERGAPRNEERVRKPRGQKRIAVAIGRRVPLEEAYRELQTLLDEAKAKAPDQSMVNGVLDPCWMRVQEYAELILLSKTNDPVALTALADVENAHGHTAFAACYGEYALRALTWQHA